MAEIIEKYINFGKHGNFFPMIDPYEMINHGVHEGQFLMPDQTAFDSLPAIILDKIHSKCNPQKYVFPRPDPSKNFYGVIESVPPFANLINGKVVDSYEWLIWYFKMYEGVRGEFDEQMIRWWAIVCNWGTNKAQGSPEVDQMLLQYAWAPGWKWKGNLANYELKV